MVTANGGDGHCHGGDGHCYGGGGYCYGAIITAVRGVMVTAMEGG